MLSSKDKQLKKDNRKKEIPQLGLDFAALSEYSSKPRKEIISMNSELLHALENKINDLVAKYNSLKEENERLKEENNRLYSEKDGIKSNIDALLGKLEGI